VWLEAGHGGVARDQRIEFQAEKFEFVAEVLDRPTN